MANLHSEAYVHPRQRPGNDIGGVPRVEFRMEGESRGPAGDTVSVLEAISSACDHETRLMGREILDQCQESVCGILDGHTNPIVGMHHQGLRIRSECCERL